ncbi:TetR/AcrR family transcriptional regulator [Mycobacterium sp. NPDC050041]|uniref:TetR/AcrR family transcriptional regulator n=1 Tax=Mycobacterium sp. NPDC050041 TaxID=3364293 RepID=UPI003C305F11
MRSTTDRRPPNRSDARRDAILSALDEWLRETTLDDVNIAHIAQQAGVTRSAFYFYFENKAAAVAALMERIVDETFVVNDTFTAMRQPPPARVRAMLDGLFDTWERHRHLFSAMLEARGSSASVREIWDSAREAFVDSIAAMIRADRAAGVAPAGADAEVLATVLLEFNDRLLERLTLGGTLTPAQLLDGAAAVWLGAIYGINTAPDRSQEQP